MCSVVEHAYVTTDRCGYSVCSEAESSERVHTPPPNVEGIVDGVTGDTFGAVFSYLDEYGVTREGVS